MLSKPYISVSGVSELEDAVAVATGFGRLLGSSGLNTHVPVIGYQVCQATFEHGQPPARKYPEFNRLLELLDCTSDRVVNCIHYSTKNKNGVVDQISRLLSTNGIYREGLCRMVQLNAALPEAVHLERLKEKFPDLRLILQFGWGALRRLADHDHLSLSGYCSLIDYVLVDPSGGRGLVFDLARMTPFIQASRAGFPSATLILAGGFSAFNVRARLGEMDAGLAMSDFGVDAEGALRIPDMVGRDSTFSVYLALDYVAEAVSFFSDRATARPESRP